jgi:HSP20 family molecular chaperone IbpA
MDKWMANPFGTTFGMPTTMDMFDPFDELDSIMAKNLHWLQRPEFLTPVPMAPKVPQKYRITVDVKGFLPDSIKTEMKGHQLTVYAKEEEHHGGQDFVLKEFKKTYQLPKEAETDKLVSFVTSHGHLVLEVPLKETMKHRDEDLFPRIINTKAGKEVSMRFKVPYKIDPSKVTVSIKDRDLIVKAENVVEKPDGISKFFYYKRTMLPENTMFSKLKCSYDNHHLTVSAPVDLDFKVHKNVPIDYKPPQQFIGH